jgi:hypothetical protein
MTIRRRSRPPARPDERGVALALAVGVAFVVVLLSTVAIEQSVNSITQSAIANKQVSSVDASEAGIQYEVNQLNAQAASGSSTFQCPTGAASLTGQGAFGATYAVSYAYGTVAPSASQLQACPTSGSIPLVPGDTYLIQSTGTTSARTVGAKTEQVLVKVPAVSTVTYAKNGDFHEALFAGVDILGGGSFAIKGSGDTYSGAIGLCTSNWSFGGNYFSDGTPIAANLLPVTVLAPTTFDGACSVAGNLYMNNAAGAIITGGSGVGGSAYSTGTVSLSGGAGVGGSVWSTSGGVVVGGGGSIGGSVYSGDALLGVTMTGGTKVAGSIYSAGPVSLANGPSTTNVYAGGAVALTSSTVTGSVYSTGAVTLTSGTYGNIYANGPVTVTGGATVTGTIYSSGGVSDLNGSIGTVEVGAGSVTYLAKATGPAYVTSASQVLPYIPSYQGPTSVIVGIPSGFPLPYVPTVTTSTIGATVAAQLVAAANAVNNTTTGTTTTVTFPGLTFDQAAWLDNTAFCGSATPCTTATMNFVVNDDCNVSAQVGSNTVLDPNSVWQVIKNTESPGALPTVLQTDCQFVWGDSYLKGYGIALDANLAVFDTAGFTFPSSFSGLSSGDGKAHQFYAIVPSSSTTVPNLGQPNVYAATLLNTLFGSDYPNGEATCNLVDGPDINIQAPLTDSGDLIQDFVYTPANVCSLTGNATLYGRVYAGQSVWANSNWNQTFYDISPWSGTSGGGGGGGGGGGTVAGTPVVQVVQSAANPTGTS